MAVSDETKDMLEQVKKGKPRKFVMLTKGTEIISLVLYKKGSASKFIKEAKESGKGIPCYGVVDGKGMDITFKLAASEGFDKAPVKSTVLKKFLEDEAELKCKPLFEIVATPPAVLDEDDPLHARFMKLMKAAMEACDAHPNSASAINQLCAGIPAKLDDEDPDLAEGDITKLEQLLNSLKGAPQVQQQPNVTTEVDTSTTNGSTLEAQKTQLAEALKKLKPAVDKAIEVDPGRKNELFQSVAQIAGEIKTGKLEEAKSNIVSLGKLVQGLLNQKAGSSSPNADPMALENAYKALYERLEGKLVEAVKANPDKANALNNLWNYANDQAEAKNFASANTALEKLEAAIDKAIAEAPKTDAAKFGIREGIVAEKIDILEKYFMERFNQAKANSQAQIESVEKAIAAQVPDEDAADLASAIQLEVDNLYEQAREELTISVAKENPEKVLAKIDAWRKNVESDDLVKHLQNSKKDLGSDANVLDDFNQLFNEVADKVAEVANV